MQFLGVRDSRWSTVGDSRNRKEQWDGIVGGSWRGTIGNVGKSFGKHRRQSGTAAYSSRRQQKTVGNSGGQWGTVVGHSNMQEETAMDSGEVGNCGDSSVGDSRGRSQIREP